MHLNSTPPPLLKPTRIHFFCLQPRSLTHADTEVEMSLVCPRNKMKANVSKMSYPLLDIGQQS